MDVDIQYSVETNVICVVDVDIHNLFLFYLNFHI